jgi:hypothetical protein
VKLRLFRLAALAVLILSTLLPAPPAQAAAELKTRLVGFPGWVGPGDILKVGLEIQNPGDAMADRLQVAITIYQGPKTRTQLHRTYSGNLGTILASDTIKLPDTIEPGGTRTVEVDKPLTEVAAFRNAPDDRAYPVRVVVKSADVSSKPLDTYMIFFNAPPERPLGISLVVPLRAPSIYLDGDQPEVVKSDSLFRSVTSGRLAKLLAALEKFPDVPVTIVPSGLLLSMLTETANGYVRQSGQELVAIGREDPKAQAAAAALARLRTIAARPATRVVATTYSGTSIPALVKAGLAERARAEVREGLKLLGTGPEGALKSQPLTGWLLPDGGRLDDRSFEEIQQAGFNRIVLSRLSLNEPDTFLTRGRPVRLPSPSGKDSGGSSDTLGFVSDIDLDGLLKDAGSIGMMEWRQRILAETATIMLERPGENRAVLMVAPADWGVSLAGAEAVISAVGQAPWLTATTPDAIASDISPPSGGPVRLASQETILKDGPGSPGAAYFASINDALKAIGSFAGLAPPANRLLKFQQRLFIAESTDWWGTDADQRLGRRFAQAIPIAVAREINMIRGPAPQTITMTSRSGVIPLSVGSGLAYPVNVVVRLDSDKLRFPDGDRIVIDKLAPPNLTIRVRAITQSSGTFPLRVQIMSPKGLRISDTLLTIRSTAYNIVALAITGGAAVFLMGWWAVGAARRRIKWSAAS